MTTFWTNMNAHTYTSDYRMIISKTVNVDLTDGISQFVITVSTLNWICPVRVSTAEWDVTQTTQITE